MAIHLRPRQLTAQKNPCFPLRVWVKQRAHQIHTSRDTWGLVVTMWQAHGSRSGTDSAGPDLIGSRPILPALEGGATMCQEPGSKSPREMVQTASLCPSKMYMLRSWPPRRWYMEAGFWQVMGFQWGHEGDTLRMDKWHHKYRRKQDSSLSTPTHPGKATWAHGKKVIICKPGTHLPWILHFSASRTVRNTHLLYKLPSRWYFVRKAWAGYDLKESAMKIRNTTLKLPAGSCYISLAHF